MPRLHGVTMIMISMASRSQFCIHLFKFFVIDKVDIFTTESHSATKTIAVGIVPFERTLEHLLFFTFISFHTKCIKDFVLNVVEREDALF